VPEPSDSASLPVAKSASVEIVVMAADFTVPGASPQAFSEIVTPVVTPERFGSLPISVKSLIYMVPRGGITHPS
jgi:hypothetical protein